MGDVDVEKHRTESGAARKQAVVNWRLGLDAEHMVTLFADVAHDTNALAAHLPLVPPLLSSVVSDPRRPQRHHIFQGCVLMFT